MQYNQPYGITDPNAPYINGNPEAGVRGSIPPAASIEYPQRELVNFFSDAGFTPDNADLRQLGKSVQSGWVIRGIDQGAVNVLSIALTPPLEAYLDGMHVWVRVAITNTGPAVLSINGLVGCNIVRRGGAILQPGDLPGGYYALFVYNGPHNNFELYGASYAPATGIPVLSANSNLYVNAATGSDTLYDGTTPGVAAPHGPFKTIARAMSETFKYGPSVYTMTINVAAGTYPEAVQVPLVLGPTVIIQGAGITQTFVTGANNSHTFNVVNQNRMVVHDVCVSTGTGTGPPAAFSAGGGGKIITSNTASRGFIWYIFEAYGGYITVGTHTFNAGSSAYTVFSAFFGGFFAFSQNAVFTFAGAFSITNSGATVICSANGTMEVPVPGSPTFPGAGFVSGQKYNVTANATVVTQGNGINYFPGTLAGAVGTGGVYS